ncbi:MAG: zinc dependent phospholipase C family protein, partial [Pseudomonadota bacterium]
MSRDILTEIIYAHRCRSTHHYIVVDALAHLTGPDADTWRDLFLVEHASLLRGAKAPDAEFKDFKNHVLHVGGDKEWGGARGAATEWYDRAVDALKARKWVAGAYALGVLSHYYADPLQPFHTGQTEEEGILHGALEWSLFKSRPVLKQRMESRPAATVHAGTDSGFVSDMVRAGAGASFPHYQTFIDHYDIHAGKKRPEDGPDDVLLDAAADLLNHAIRGVALLMSRAIEDAGVKPKTVSTSLPTFMARLDIPVRKMLKKIDDAGARREIEAAYKEFEATGKVIKALSDDDAEIRALHAKQVAGRDLKDLDAQAPQPTGRKFEGR